MPSKELKYIISLSRKNFNAIGFIPGTKIELLEAKGQIIYEYDNDELCGFLIYGRGWPILNVYQSCIQYEARRIYHGLNLIKRLIKYADSKKYSAISLWCANDLEANKFWQSCGFQFLGQKEGGERRKRKLNRWVLWLNGYPKLIKGENNGTPARP